VVQTAVGLLWIQPDSVVLPREVYTDHALVMSSKYAPRLAQVVPLLIGTKNGEAILQACGKQLVEFTYWWGVPAAQFFLAL
jgi:sphinganine C4-monooxygenase